MDATEHGFTATRNLIIQPPELQSSACNYGIFDNGGRNNIIRSNLCVGYPTCVRLADYNLISTPQFSEGMVRNLEPFHYRQPPYSSAYPGLAGLDPNISLPLIGNCSKREQCGSAPWHVEVTSNVAVNGSARLIPYGPETSPIPSEIPGRFNFSSNAMSPCRPSALRRPSRARRTAGELRRILRFFERRVASSRSSWSWWAHRRFALRMRRAVPCPNAEDRR